MFTVIHSDHALSSGIAFVSQSTVHNWQLYVKSPGNSTFSTVCGGGGEEGGRTFRNCFCRREWTIDSHRRARRYSLFVGWYFLLDHSSSLLKRIFQPSPEDQKRRLIKFLLFGFSLFIRYHFFSRAS